MRETEVIATRVARSDAVLVGAAAAAEGLSISEWLRRTVLPEARRAVRALATVQGPA